MYRLEFTKQAAEDALRLRKSEQQAYSKLEKLLQELKEHPKTGTGKPEMLGHNRAGQWSRRITQKHRLVYTINDDTVIVEILSTRGHYD